MPINNQTGTEIRRQLTDSIRSKLRDYNPETEHKPFHHALFGRDRYAMFSFLQSINTTFGMSIWEQVAVILANAQGYEPRRQYLLLGSVEPVVVHRITEIVEELRATTRDVDKARDSQIIRNITLPGEAHRHNDSVVDLMLTVNGTQYLFDVTSVKPNIKEFVALKKKLLVWDALAFSQNQLAQVQSRLAIPYNPYYPDPYARFTLRGMFDLPQNEVMIAEQFWDFVGGGNVYQSLLDIFIEVGNSLRPEIDARFERLRNG